MFVLYNYCQFTSQDDNYANKAVIVCATIMTIRPQDKTVLADSKLP